MTTMNQILKNSVNSVMNAVAEERGMTNPHFAWGISQYPKLKTPFNERVSVGDGANYMSSLYYDYGMRNQMQPCILSRKAIYKVLHELGYYYASYSNPNELWVGIYDGNLDEVNDKIDGKEVGCQRMIHMHIVDNKIVEACESDLAGSKPLEFGPKAHSAVAYIAAQLLNLSQNSCDDGTVRDEFNRVKEKFDKKEFDGEFQEWLTILENDVLIVISDDVDESRRAFIMTDANELLSQARDNGKRVFDFADRGTTKAKVKVTVPRKAMTIADVAKKGLYTIEHVFNGDENLVPEEYDDMDFTPQVEEVCGIIKASKSLPFAMNMNFLFTGEAGTGKSTASGQIARVLGVPRRILTCSKGMEEFRITQRLIPNPKKVSESDADFVYVDSEIVEAFKNGGIIEVQEANTLREGVITVLNAALDDSGELHLYDGSIIKRHPNCIFIFSMNVGYEGTRNMNQSFLSRCSFKEEFVLPERKVLVERIVNKYKIDNELAKEMAQAFLDVRNTLQESGDTDGVCSYRELVAWVEALKANEEIRKIVPSAPELSVYDAAQRTIVPSAAPKDMDLRAELSGVVAKMFSNI